MIDPPTPLSDEELSAVIDGEAEPDVTARFTADPTARQRAADLQEASDLLRRTMVEPLSAGTVDDLVARALGHLDSQADGTDAETDGADPDGDAADRPTVDAGSPNVVAFTRPEPPARRGNTRWLVAAVVAVLAGLGLTLVYNGTRPTLNEDASVAQSPGSTAGSAPEEDLPDGAGDATPATPGDTSNAVRPASPYVDLGPFDTQADLRERLKTAFPTGPLLAEDAAPSADAVNRCAQQVYELFASEGIATAPTRSGVAVLDGEQVMVFEFAITEPDATFEDLVVATTSVDVCEPTMSFVRG